MNPWLYIIGLVCTLFSGVGGQILIETIRRKRRASKRHVFISFPIKAIQDIEQRERLQNIINKVHSDIIDIYPDISVFASKDDKEDKELIKQTDDFEALKESREYFLIYPEKLASSVLVELGCALCEKKPTTIFVKHQEDLPYLITRRCEKRDKTINIIRFTDEKCLMKN